MSFVFLDSAGVQRVGETCDNLEGKGDSGAVSEDTRAALRDVSLSPAPALLLAGRPSQTPGTCLHLSLFIKRG